MSSKASDVLALDSAPSHVAVIMDGNGRWAKSKNLDRIEGHKAGMKNAKQFVSSCFAKGVEIVTLFAFSSENWARPADEVEDLMTLFYKYLLEDSRQFEEEGIRVTFIGDFAKINPETVAVMQEVEKNTAEYKKRLFIAISYGGRLDIVNAARAIVADCLSGKLSLDDVEEETFAQNLMTADLPEPDLLIRTGGEHRVSNFMLWQIAYTELYFCDKFWPDFDEAEIDKAFLDYKNRERRYGK